jgi:hypothetical protein
MPLSLGLYSVMFLMCKREDALNKHELFALLPKSFADMIGDAP